VAKALTSRRGIQLQLDLLKAQSLDELCLEK
jgi:hypothetical protein